jgi:type IV pilus assembly protein PilA
LVELVIVVVIIGLLAALAVPMYKRLNTRTKHTRFQNELRVATQALETYAMERGDWPPDGDGGWPAEVVDYLPPPNRWNLPTPVGGRWSWTRDVDGVRAALRVSDYEGGEERGRALDRLVDDGDLTAGTFRGAADHLLYVMQP